MRRIRIGYLLIAALILLSANNLMAEEINKGKIMAEAASVFRQYRLALKNEDYALAFSLEPDFIQKSAGNAETYKKWWSDIPEMDEWRRLYSKVKIAKIEVLTPKRAAILVTSSDERMSRIAFYMILEYDKWKVACFGHLFKHIKEELEELKSTIARYYEKNARLPENLSELTPDYIEALPIDLFNDKNESYQYFKKEEEFLIYSFGPDSDDDSGKVEYDYNNGLLSNGDFSIRNCVQETEFVVDEFSFLCYS